MINRHLAHLWRQMKIHRILTHVCLHQIGCLCYCCYAKTSSSAVHKRHSKVQYGNLIAPSLYSILLVYDLQNIKGKNTILESETLPTHFHNKNCKFNNKYYKETKETISKIKFLNNIFEANQIGLNEQNEDTLENLSQLPGLSIYQRLIFL